jgi:hypothetical protein
VTPDGKYFFFASSRLARVEVQAPRTYDQLLAGLRGPGNGLGDLYRVELSAVLKDVPNAKPGGGAVER